MNVPVGGIIFNDRFNDIADTIKDLGKSCEQLGIQYTSKLSTLEVAVSQQMIQIRKLEEQVKDLKQVNKHLSDTADGFFYRLVEVDPSYAPDSVPLDVQGGTPLHNPDILQCEVCEPYPYTHPIRETGESDKVRVKK